MLCFYITIFFVLNIFCILPKQLRPHCAYLLGCAEDEDLVQQLDRAGPILLVELSARLQQNLLQEVERDLRERIRGPLNARHGYVDYLLERAVHCLELGLKQVEQIVERNLARGPRRLKRLSRKRPRLEGELDLLKERADDPLEYHLPKFVGEERAVHLQDVE